MAGRNLDGRVVLITGATDGLGRGLALDAARLGATVLVHGRSEERIAAALEEVRAAGPGDARAYRADLASLAAVAALAGEILEREPRLDVLVNNAGLGVRVPGDGRRAESDDGIEVRFAVNYLAGHLLTRRLLGLLRASAPARIVNVSSLGQMPIDFGDPMLEHDYDGMRAYCQSKLAQVLFTIDLAAELEGSGVTVNALHPGTFMPTKISAGDPRTPIEDGVEATMRLIADPAFDGVSGRYFNALEGEARAKDQAYDPEARRQLRELSERLVAGVASTG